jgi:hypothetical protein
MKFLRNQVRLTYLLSALEIRHGWISSAQPSPNLHLLCISKQNLYYEIIYFVSNYLSTKVKVRDSNEPTEVLPVLEWGGDENNARLI